MLQVNFLSTNLYSHEKVKKSCVNPCNYETKLSEGVKKNMYKSFGTVSEEMPPGELTPGELLLGH